MPLLNQLKGDIMAYKNIKHDFSFADFAIQSFADKNRTLLFLLQVGNTIDWQPIQELLIKYYERGKSLSSFVPIQMFPSPKMVSNQVRSRT